MLVEYVFDDHCDHVRNTELSWQRFPLPSAAALDPETRPSGIADLRDAKGGLSGDSGGCKWHDCSIGTREGIVSDLGRMSEMWPIPKELVNPTFFTIAHLERCVREDDEVAAAVLRALRSLGANEIDALDGVGEVVDDETLKLFLSALRDQWHAQRPLGQSQPD